MKKQFKPALLVALGTLCLAYNTPLAHAETRDIAKPKHKHKSGPALTAATLVVDMQKSIAFIAKNAKDKINIKYKANIPFWAALRDCSKAVDQIEAGVKAGDENTLLGLDALGISINQLAGSWGVIRSSAEGSQIGRGVIALSKAYDVFLYHYGPSIARKHVGGEVTQEEIEILADARDQVSTLKAQFSSINSKVSSKSYQKRFIHDILVLCLQIEKIKGNDLDDYCEYLLQYNRLMYTTQAYISLLDAWYPDTAQEYYTICGGKPSKRRTLAFDRCTRGYYKDWNYTTIPVTQYDDYYEVTYSVSSISETEETTYESYSESYSEETSTEESSEESTLISKETSFEENENTSFAEEVADGTDDRDGDGISDEKDSDDNNDGVMESDGADKDSSAEDSNDGGAGNESASDSNDGGGGNESASDSNDSGGGNESASDSNDSGGGNESASDSNDSGGGNESAGDGNDGGGGDQ